MRACRRSPRLIAHREFVLPPTKSVIENVPPGVPVLHFGTGTATLLELMREAGGDVIGLDWRVRLDEGWRRVGHDVAVMGDLDDELVAFLKPMIWVSTGRRYLKLKWKSASSRPSILSFNTHF